MKYVDTTSQITIDSTDRLQMYAIFHLFIWFHSNVIIWPNSPYIRSSSQFMQKTVDVNEIHLNIGASFAFRYFNNFHRNPMGFRSRLISPPHRRHQIQLTIFEAIFIPLGKREECFAHNTKVYSKKENSYSRLSHTLFLSLFLPLCARFIICSFSSFLVLLFSLLLLLLSFFFFHFVGSYADSVEIEQRSTSRRWAHSTKSQSPIFAEHFSSESLTQLFFSHRSFASAAKCNRTPALPYRSYISTKTLVHVFKYTRFLFQYYTAKRKKK